MHSAMDPLPGLTAGDDIQGIENSKGCRVAAESRLCSCGAKAVAHDRDMFCTMIEVMEREPRWLILLATSKLRMLTRTTLNASRMPEFEGPATAKVGPGFRHRVIVTLPAIHRPIDRRSRISGRKDLTFPLGEPDAG